MKRFLSALPILLIVVSANAFASSTTIYLSPNTGSGDNFAFVQGGTFLNGGIPYVLFNTQQGFAPGSTFGISSDVFFVNAVVTIGNVPYDLAVSGPGTLFVSSFTFPSGGKDFSIRLTASFSVQGAVFVDGQTIQIDIGGSAPGTMLFTWDQSQGMYFGNFTVFTTAPEPGTLGLMGTGLMGLLAFARKRLAT